MVVPLVVIEPVLVAPPLILNPIYVCEPVPALKHLKVVSPVAACTFNFASTDVSQRPSCRLSRCGRVLYWLYELINLPFLSDLK